MLAKLYKVLPLGGMCLLSLLITLACERNIDVDLPMPERQIVVDGFIETGAPPVVVLNTNFPYFEPYSIAQYQAGFIHNANVRVSDGNTEVLLEEYCWSSLTEAQRLLLATFLGASLPDSLPANFDYCAYFSPTLLGEAGHTYTLDITTTDGETLHAQTSIPQVVGLDSLYYIPHADSLQHDSLRLLYVVLNDPDTLGNYYRAFTATGSQEPFLASFSSVYDDVIINGQNFAFPMDRAQPRSDDFELDGYGYFSLGDTARVKWTCIDEDSFLYFRNLEYGANAAGPFAGVVQTPTTIEGGLGIWVGYASSYYQIVIND